MKDNWRKKVSERVSGKGADASHPRVVKILFTFLQGTRNFNKQQKWIAIRAINKSSHKCVRGSV